MPVSYRCLIPVYKTFVGVLSWWSIFLFFLGFTFPLHAIERYSRELASRTQEIALASGTTRQGNVTRTNNGARRPDSKQSSVLFIPETESRLFFSLESQQGSKEQVF